MFKAVMGFCKNLFNIRQSIRRKRYLEELNTINMLSNNELSTSAKINSGNGRGPNNKYSRYNEFVDYTPLDNENENENDNDNDDDHDDDDSIESSATNNVTDFERYNDLLPSTQERPPQELLTTGSNTDSPQLMEIRLQNGPKQRSQKKNVRQARNRSENECQNIASGANHPLKRLQKTAKKGHLKSTK